MINWLSFSVNCLFYIVYHIGKTKMIKYHVDNNTNSVQAAEHVFACGCVGARCLVCLVNDVVHLVTIQVNTRTTEVVSAGVAAPVYCSQRTTLDTFWTHISSAQLRSVS